jgi:hypothetical protein
MDEPITSPLPSLKKQPAPEQAKPSSSTLTFQSGFSLSVEAQENLNMSKAGAFLARAEKDLKLTNGGAGAIVAGKDLKVENGGAITIVSGGDFELENGGAQIMIVGGNMNITTGGTAIAIPGGNMTVNKGFVGVVLAKEAHLNEGSQLLLDTPRALVFGAAFGAVFALVRWLLKR